MRSAVLLFMPGCRESFVPTRIVDADVDANRGILCASDGQCPEGERCWAGICAEAGDVADAASVAIDAAATFDARTSADAKAEDAEAMDTGAEDTGAEDLGVADGGIPTLDLAGYQLQNQEQGNQVATLPSGTILVPGDVVIIARDATQSDFEAEWGVRLAANVHFLSTGAANTGAPIVNGGEQWALVSASGVLVDGVTIAGQAGHSYQRLSGSDPSAPDAWLDQSDLLGTPGTASLPAHLGLVISEWSDRTGNGKFGYEFVELWYDP